MSISLSALRQDLFKSVDQVIATGIPIEVKRKGRIVKIIVEDKKDKLANLKSHDCVVGDLDDLVEFKMHHWNKEPELWFI